MAEMFVNDDARQYCTYVHMHMYMQNTHTHNYMYRSMHLGLIIDGGAYYMPPPPPPPPLCIVPVKEGDDIVTAWTSHNV